MKPFTASRITYYVSRFTFYVFLLLLILATAKTALAQQPTPSDDDINAIARQLYCPVCENTPLDVCPTQACAQWRALIRQMLAEGKSSDEIKQYFVENYGGWISAILRQIVLKNIPQLFWAWSLSEALTPMHRREGEAKSQNDEGEEIFVAGTKIFWF